MITGAMIVTKYGDSTKERRLDMICKYYPCFLEIVDSFIEDMEDDIRNEQDYNRRASLGDLGVRVQTSGLSNRTQKEAVRNVSLRNAILNGDFGGGELDDTDHTEDFIYNSETVRSMIADYNKFQKKIDGLLPPDKKLFLAYLQQETDLSQIAEESGIAYESAKQKIRRIKVTIKKDILTPTYKRG